MWLELFLLLLLILIADDYIRRWRIESKLRGIPNVSSIPLVGAGIVLSTFQPDNLHVKFKEFVMDYGKTFYAIVFGRVMVVTADGRYSDAVLSSHVHIRKHFIYNMLRSWLGNGLLLSYGQEWQNMRKIITPTFHFKILEEFIQVFDRQSEILVQKLQPFADGRYIVDIYPYIGLAALDIITETAMGVQVNAQLNEKSEIVQAVKDVTNILATRFVRPHLALKFLYRLFWPSAYKKQFAGICTMHAFTDAIIEKRRKLLQAKIIGDKPTAPETDQIGIKQRNLALLDVLLQSTIDGQPLTDRQIRDEVNTFVFEGHDTTTSATSFCLYLLSRHPDVQQKLFQEIRTHFGDNLAGSICCSDLHQLNYLNCVVKEALRLYPPIPAIGRYLKEDLNLVDTTLPAGTNVIILLWQLLRDPDIFPEPEVFHPDRHLEYNPRANAYSNIPFSAGPRNCIGQRFALFEMKTILVKMLRNYELLALGERIQPSIKIVLRSKTGVQFGIRARSY